MSVQAQTALLARVTGRPVKLVLSREESIRLHPKRHPIRCDYTVGCDAEGRLTAVRARMVGDTGAYASVGGKVLERAAGHACGPYRVPARRRRGGRRLHQQPALRRDARLRRQPGRTSPSRAASTSSPRRSGSTAGRSAGATSSRSATSSATGQVLEKSVGARADARGGEGRLRRGARRAGRAVGHRLRHQEQRHRQRRRGVGQVPAGGRGGRHASRSTTATPRWARACSPCSSSSRSR